MCCDICSLALVQPVSTQPAQPVQPRPVRGMRVNMRRAAAFASGGAALLSVARVAVLFLEALSAVRDERHQDAELILACRDGVARGSHKMRAACVQAQADRASPILLKAVLRAVSTAWNDFAGSVSSPTKLLVVVLFVASSLFLPVHSWVRLIFPPERELEGRHHVVVLAQDAEGALRAPRATLRRRLARRLKHIRLGGRGCRPQHYDSDGDSDGDDDSWNVAVPPAVMEVGRSAWAWDRSGARDGSPDRFQEVDIAERSGSEGKRHRD